MWSKIFKKKSIKCLDTIFNQSKIEKKNTLCFSDDENDDDKNNKSDKLSKKLNLNYSWNEKPIKKANLSPQSSNQDNEKKINYRRKKTKRSMSVENTRRRGIVLKNSASTISSSSASSDNESVEKFQRKPRFKIGLERGNRRRSIPIITKRIENRNDVGDKINGKSLILNVHTLLLFCLNFFFTTNKKFLFPTILI